MADKYNSKIPVIVIEMLCFEYSIEDKELRKYIRIKKYYTNISTCYVYHSLDLYKIFYSEFCFKNLHEF